MVTTRKPGDNYSLFLAKAKEYFEYYGRNDFTIYNYNTEKLPSGRFKSRSATTQTNVLGDLQFSSKQLRSYIYQGIAKTGDGIFYTLGTITVNLNDEILVAGKRYKLTRQVEGEDLDKKVPYQGWIAVLIPE